MTMYLERAANNGNHYAAYLAGKILMTEETLKDIPRAVRFFEMAAKQGNPYAEFQLGKMYLFGNDIPKDFDTARWATKPEIRKTYAHVPYTPSTFTVANPCPAQAISRSIRAVFPTVNMSFSTL